MRRSFAGAMLTLAGATAAHAATANVDVRGADGRPVADAVVTLDMPGMAPVPLRGPYVVAQANISFQPHVLIVPVGAVVQFPNRDRVRHHVYSFSRPKRFDLKLYGREEQRSVTFDKPGAVALGCNIHDAMSGFVYVTPSRFAAVTDAAGHVAFAGVPAGTATVTVWHPSIRRPGNVQAQPLALPSRGLATVVTLQP